MDLTIPIEMEKDTTKELIIKILALNWPLTIKKIHNTIKKQYAKSVTYQAVHKTLNLLIEKKIVLKQDKEYSLNIEWANKIENFAHEIQSSYAKKLQAFGIKDYKKEGDMQTITFADFGDAEKYRKKLQVEYIKKPQPKHPYIGISQHYKSPIVFSEKSLDILDLIKETLTTCYMVCQGNTRIDKWFAKYYMNNPLVNIQIGKDCATDCETMVLGDVIVQTYVPRQIQRYVESVYQDSLKISDINVPEFYKKVYNTKIDTKIIVFKNPEIAQQIRNQVLSKFNVDKFAFFDIDGVLVKDFSMLSFAEFLHERKLFKNKYLEEMKSAVLKYRNDDFGYIEFCKKFAQSYANGMEGNDVEKINKLVKEFVAHIELYDYSKDLLRALGKMKKVAVTASTMEIITGLSEILPFDHIEATTLLTKDGKYTGKIGNNLVLDKAKHRAVSQYLKNNPGNLMQSIAFGDTEHDLCILEKVGNPVALNPNKELMRIAEEKNWLISDGDVDEIMELIRK